MLFRWLPEAEANGLAGEYDLGYTKVMKTAISIPDPVFKAADRLARKRRVSRSELYTRAIQALLKAECDDEITARLDEAYGEDTGALAPDLRLLPSRILEQEDW